jgi:hypothetical protein
VKRSVVHSLPNLSVHLFIRPFAHFSIFPSVHQYVSLYKHLILISAQLIFIGS